MAFTPKDAVAAARDIATHAVQKASDIVEDASHIIKGDVAGGTSAIVQDSLDIATHAVDRTKELFTGTDEDTEDVDDEVD
ncbi:hypothetical protein [Mycobacterium talmoniae]|uniref:Uncharacterized protein n=1 Tax=Mycobacterium talmoniae TaxID=1858794 RepID=A0A1S1MZ10_9MYCO|nr:MULTISPECIES: hypothetical protein [Mycobacterium]OHU92267.1 hypothetical protein BKN37_25335 [Mycobacterium talmoniae]PQM47224.1 hypothetical protein C1Y40_02596 [Mycobacterium talmoniae]TDH47956.1 hypothetical protein E2F47_25755 [Mycobacterium eburneum]